MNPSEAWALLTLRSKNFDRTPGGHGSMTASDVAAMLAGLEREPFLTGMAAECADFGALKQIELCLRTRAYTMAENGEWQPPRGLLRAMVALALYEVIDDRHCYACNGRGQMVFTLNALPELIMAPSFKRLDEGKAQVTCIACIGEGQVNLSDRRKAEIMGMGRDTWRRHWARKYEPIFGVANSWREIAKGYLAGRVKEMEEEPCVAGVAQPVSEPIKPDAEKPLKYRETCTILELHGKTPSVPSRAQSKRGPENLDFSPLSRPLISLPKKRVSRVS
jgi:hypothetical protein